jgi:hypothetical protein
MMIKLWGDEEYEMEAPDDVRVEDIEDELLREEGRVAHLYFRKRKLPRLYRLRDLGEEVFLELRYGERREFE